jgi:hypothetical protein
MSAKAMLSEASMTALRSPVVASVMVRVSEVFATAPSAPVVESVRVMESEIEPERLTTQTASSVRLRVSEALLAYEFSAVVIRPLKGATENGEKPNIA